MLLASALSVQAIAAYCFAKSNTTEGLSWAVRIQPLNAKYEELLGVAYMGPASGDFDHAVFHLQRAVAMNPYAASGWLNLANAYVLTGDQEHRVESVRRALACEPKNPKVQWEAANLFIGTDLDRGLDLLRGAMESSPGYTVPGIRVAYFSANHDVEKTMRGVPNNAPARLQLLHWLLEQKEYGAADRVWPTLMAAPGELRTRDTFLYLDSLIERHQVAQARAAWLALTQSDPSLRGHEAYGNLVLNGGFEEPLLNGGFGWRFVPTTGVRASLDTTTFHDGSKSLFLHIDGENVQDSGFSELIAVTPGAHYRFSGWLHAEDLESAHGIRLAIRDAYTNAELLTTDEVLGSAPWRELAGEFVAPAETQLVKLVIVRSPAEGRIRGTLWVDDLRIEKR